MTANLARRYGPVAMVTGASDGIGRAFAAHLARAGFDLRLVARRQDALDALAARLVTDHGIQVQVVACDLGTKQGLARARRALRDSDVGLLIAAAGFGSSGDFVATDIDHERDMLRVNCEAVLALTHDAARTMTDRGRGAIVLMSSLVGFQGVPRSAHYAATKAYIQTLAEGLQRELKPAGVRVVACAPGPVNSGFANRAGMTMGKAATPDTVAGETLRRLPRAATIRPGFLAKLLEYAMFGLPRWARTRILQQVMRSMTPTPARAPDG